MFIPDTVWRWDEEAEDDNDFVPLDRADDPDAWLRLAYANRIVTIQVDDGRPAGPGLTGGECTSSASMPTNQLDRPLWIAMPSPWPSPGPLAPVPLATRRPGAAGAAVPVA